MNRALDYSPQRVTNSVTLNLRGVTKKVIPPLPKREQAVTEKVTDGYRKGNNPKAKPDTPITTYKKSITKGITTITISSSLKKLFEQEIGKLTPLVSLAIQLFITGKATLAKSRKSCWFRQPLSFWGTLYVFGRGSPGKCPGSLPPA